MKNNKIIYLTAFLLSLSLILLLEAGSLRLLAEDIKIQEKEEVEIELLLSASKQFSGEENQSDDSNEVKSETKETVAQDQNDEEEVDKNSLAEKKDEIEEEKKELVEDNVIEEKEQPKKEVKQRENKLKESQVNNIEDTQQEKNDVNEQSDKKTKLEKTEKTVIKNEPKEKTNEPPAWMQNSANNSEKEESVEQEEQNKKDEFDLDSYIANLEAEADKKSNPAETKESNEENEAADLQSKQSSNAQEINNDTKNKNDEITPNNSANNAAAAKSKTDQENKVYDLRKGKSDSIKKPGIRQYSQPEYPSNLRRRNIEGKVIVSLRIDTAGKIHDLKLNESSGYDSFDQAALKAVRQWEFKAAEKDGEKIEVIVNLPIKFELN
jgi:TonB family protein